MQDLDIFVTEFLIKKKKINKPKVSTKANINNIFADIEVSTKLNYGFMVYSQNDDMFYGITVDNVEELTELFSTDTEIYEPLFRLSVGKTLTLKYSTIWTIIF